MKGKPKTSTQRGKKLRQKNGDNQLHRWEVFVTYDERPLVREFLRAHRQQNPRQ